jgi:HK97 gp10 family phage protein
MDDFTVTLKGLDPILDRLRQLPPRAANRAMRRALRKGGNVIRDVARSNARAIDNPETSNAIFRNIVVQGGGRRTERREGGPVMRVGVLGGARNYAAYGEIKTGRSGKGNPGGDTWYWRLVEFGTARTRARPFMRPAMQSGSAAAFAAVAAAAPAELDKELAKMGIK